MASVASILDVLARIDSSAISVHQDRCALVRNRNAGCSRCADACTSGCISFQDGELAVDPARCIGCGTCATACPTGALDVRSPSDEDILGSCGQVLRKLGDTVVIVCSAKAQRAAELIDPQRCVVVPCLGRADESLLATIACAGAERIALVCDSCETCSCESGRAVAEEVASTMRTLADAWDIPVTIELSDALPQACRQREGSYDSSRRALFSSMAEQMRTAARAAVSPATQPAQKPLAFSKVGPNGTLPQFLPERRQRLLGVLAGHGEPQDVLVDTRLWGHVLIDADRCSSCRMCTTFCPTGALARFDDPDGSCGVEHAPSACVKCRTCQHICPEQALSLSDEVFAVDLMRGVVERYPMEPRPAPRDQETAVRETMRAVLGSERIY